MEKTNGRIHDRFVDTMVATPCHGAVHVEVELGNHMLELQHRIHHGVLVLKPHKRIDSLTAPSFEEQTVALLAGGHNKVVVDFSALDYLSSAGLRVLLILAKRAKSAGGALVFCSVGNAVKDVIEVSGFGSLLGIYAGAEEACAVLSRPV